MAWYVDRTARHLGQPNALNGKHSVGQWWGTAHTATMLAIAWLNDQGHCATADSIAKIAGASTGSINAKLRRLFDPERGPVVETHRCDDLKCKTRRHYLIGF